MNRYQIIKNKVIKWLALLWSVIFISILEVSDLISVKTVNILINLVDFPQRLEIDYGEVPLSGP